MFKWMISSSVLIAVIILLRYLLKGKITVKLQYALWAVVLIRLLIPFSIGESNLSVLNIIPKESFAYHNEEAETEAAISEAVLDENINNDTALVVSENKPINILYLI